MKQSSPPVAALPAPCAQSPRPAAARTAASRPQPCGGPALPQRGSCSEPAAAAPTRQCCSHAKTLLTTLSNFYGCQILDLNKETNYKIVPQSAIQKL